MFIANENSHFKGLHQNIKAEISGVTVEEADAAMIMIHGRGADAASILSLINEIHVPFKLALIAPQASNYTWYPFSFLAPEAQNEPGLSSGLQVIYDLISELQAKEMPLEKIFILGFSQGACLASEFVARHPAKYAGLIALSGGLIGQTVDKHKYNGDLSSVPVFMGCSDIDPHIPLGRVNETEDVFNQMGAKVLKKIYKNMPHTINTDELQTIEAVFKNFRLE